MIYLADMLRIQNAQLSLFPLPSITSPKVRVFAFSTKEMRTFPVQICYRPASMLMKRAWE